MKFYVGLHHPHRAALVDRAFISVHALTRRKGDFSANQWILDSGAFTTVERHGGYPEPPGAYAAQVKRWQCCGEMQRAVSQDYMCEPWMLERTGLTVGEHQRLTVERYNALYAEVGPVLMPVLQGYEPREYARHVGMYGDRLQRGAWVGVGSVCKRQGRPDAIAEVLRTILDVRPDLRLHGFGIKVASLACASVRDRLYSADSMAWSFAARYEGRDGNDPREAIRYAARVNTMPVQECLL